MSEHDEEVLEGEVRDRPELPPEVKARREAALRHVRQWGDPVLKTSALPVQKFDEELRTEVGVMGELMNEALGIGLAATQLGRPRRVLVYRVEPESPLNALINPEIVWSGEETETLEEGCLSLPRVLVDVERAVYIRVRAFDEFGDELVIEASGLEARVIQHEMDHLDGVLILDRTSRDQRKDAIRALRAAEQSAA